MTKKIKLEFLFDFGSPNAYLCHRVIPEIEKRTGIKFEYVPILLGGIFKSTGNKSPVEAFAQIKNKPEYDQIEIQRFVSRHHIHDFQMNPYFPINTLTIMRGAIAAEKLGIFKKYVNDIYDFMWSDPRKLDDPAELMKALAEAGLPAEELSKKVLDSEIKQILLSNTAKAVERGAFGSPTFFINGEIYFGKDRLHEVEEAINLARGVS